MTRTILLSSFILALMSAQGAFSSGAANALRTAAIDKADVLRRHPEAASQADRTVGDCNENYPC